MAWRRQAPDVPETIPGYDGLERIGNGGFGIVYRARRRGLDRPVAVKVLNVDSDGAALRREVELTSRLAGHPNVVRVLDSGLTASGRPYLTMDYMPGGSLRQRVDRDGPLPVPEVLRAGVKMAGALAAAHAAGVLHRDIKPENILLSQHGEPALADFGVARQDAAGTAPTSTQALTPYHAAPEVLDGRPATAASDLYSLGSTLYQLLAGRPAFQPGGGEGLAPMLLRVLRDDPPPIDRPDVPAPVVAVVRRAMAKRPADRYPDVAGLGAALQAVEAELGLTVTELPLQPSGERTDPGLTVLRDGRALPPPPPPPPARRRRRRALVLVVALAVPLFVAASAVGLRVALAASPHTTAMTRPSRVASVPAAPSPVASLAPVPVVAPPSVPSPSAVTVTVPSAPATVTPALLGKPDFDGYCRKTGQGPVKQVANNAYGWHCSADNGTGDDAEAVCRWTFQTTKVTNRVADFNNLNSWQCWRANRRLGALDFNAYCMDTGASGATLLPDRYAYGWYCNGSTAGIDSQAACGLLYGSDPPVSRFQNFYDPKSWECWG